MRFLVRDDDACAMTRPEELEAAWSPIWDEVPVCLSVTPFRIPGEQRGVPDALWGRQEPMPLEAHGEILDFLRENVRRGRFDLALHGYHHIRVDGEPEFVTGRDLDRKAREGRACLERLFGRPVATFVPPNNTLSAAGFAAVVAAGMNIVNNQTRARLGGWSGGLEALGEATAAAGYALAGRLGRSHRYRIRRFPRYAQAPYHTAGPDVSLDELRAALRECQRVDGVFVLATHYHAFSRRMRSGETIGDAVMRLVDEARAHPGTRVVDYGGLW